MFVAWKDYCEGDTECIEDLEWVIHVGVTSPSSRDAALLATGHQLGQIPQWPPFPGYQFPIPDESVPPNEQDQTARDNFNALVGCPNGLGVAFMLQQRQDAFNHMVIDRVHAFASDGNDLVIAWHIGLVPGVEYK